jgi:demethylmenaquinone methyltransferase/2-methoxy-6-polyprenyl-1,4-benzoquinol methylase
MSTGTSMSAYYQARARDYEAVYHKPERQSDLAELRSWLTEETRGRTILEVACGTGYWTAVAASAAQSIHAIDLNSGPLEIARSKGLGPNVSFAQADAYALPDLGGEFDCGMAHFWWSHVPKAEQQRFLAHFASKLRKGAELLMIDNNFVAGSSTPISRTDAAGNTYQLRALPTAERHEVLKNFPSTSDIETALGTFCSKVHVLQLKHYWAVSAVLLS